ncbi:hypothetical protein [Nocardioides rubriscoriae]|uniref:hypothetical protein n=1 Tax=Nocardioides rubriscoriae TaxID=642762 RepID=UPI0011E06BE5|nr:hypothetical protein [Nocardioides rubriscoriae]
MTTLTTTAPHGVGRRGVVLVLVPLVAVLVLAPLLLALQVARVGTEPRDLEVGVIGPVVVSQAVVERGGGLPGDPFHAVVLAEDADPAAPVRAGLLAATVAVDFREDHNTLLVSSTLSPALVAEVRVRVEAISSSYGRSLVVGSVAPARSPDAWRGTPYAMVLAWVVAGVALAVGLSWWRGPLSATWRGAFRRTAALAASSVVVGLLVSLAVGALSSADVDVLRTGAVGAVTVAATAWLVLGSEALFGLWGLAAAVSLALCGAAPLLLATDAGTLPAPWSALFPWTVGGSALSLVRQDVFFGGGAGLRPVAVLVSWALLALLTLTAARRERLALVREASLRPGSRSAGPT